MNSLLITHEPVHFVRCHVLPQHLEAYCNVEVIIDQSPEVITVQSTQMCSSKLDLCAC